MVALNSLVVARLGEGLDGLYLALSCQSRELQRSGTDSGDGSALSSLVSSAFGLTAVHR